MQFRVRARHTTANPYLTAGAWPHRQATGASPEYRRFLARRTVPLAVRALQRETHPARAWLILDAVLQSGLPADVRFFTTMMSFCKAHAPAKAPDVLSVVAARRLAVNDALFGAFLAACLRTTPPNVGAALDGYATAAPRTHDAMLGLAHVCRVANRPASALFLVGDAVAHDVAISPRLFSILAACAAEAPCPATAERLLDLAIHTSCNAAFGNLVKALVAGRRLDAALRVLDVLDAPSDRIYTHVTSALAKGGRARDALALLRVMVAGRVHVDVPVFSQVVAACGRVVDRDAVRALAAYATRCGLFTSDVVVSAFIAAFDRCGDLAAAEGVFQRRDPALIQSVAVYNAMLAAYAHHRLLLNALSVFRRITSPCRRSYTTLVVALVRDDRLADAVDLLNEMVGAGHDVDRALLGLVIGACGRCTGVVGAVESLHAYASTKRMLQDDVVVSALIAAYDRCGDLPAAERLFHQAASPGVVPFNAMLGAYARHGSLTNALALLRRMRSSGLSPTLPTYTTMLVAFAQGHRLRDAMATFEAMVARGLPVDAPLLRQLVGACARCSDVAAVDRLHDHARTKGLLVSDAAVASAFITAYSHCGDLAAARALFSSIATTTTTSVLPVNAMIGAYGEHGALDDAIATFDAMTVPPTEQTFASLLTACSHVGDLARAQAIMSGNDVDVWSTHALNCLIDLHGRHGDLAEAERLATTSTHARPTSWRLVLVWFYLFFALFLFTQAPRSRVRGSKDQQQNANIPRPGSAGPSPLYWVHRALDDIGTGRDSLGLVDCTLVGPLSPYRLCRGADIHLLRAVPLPPRRSSETPNCSGTLGCLISKHPFNIYGCWSPGLFWGSSCLELGTLRSRDCLLTCC